MAYHVTPRSSNAKTGPILVTTSEKSTCPDVCPLKSRGCYADGGPLRLHWDKVSDGLRGCSWNGFLNQLLWELQPNQLWRHNQAGDLPGEGDEIDELKLTQLALANYKSRARGFTYTHKPPTESNLKAIRYANENGFTINLSANSLAHADELSKHDLPVVTLLPSNHVSLRSCTTPAGRKVVVCPATRSEVINCSKCALCQKRDRGFIIGFPAHGGSYKKANDVALAN